MNDYKNVNIVVVVDITKTVTCFRSGLSVSKISDIATVTNFSIPLPPLPTEILASSHPTIRVRRCQ